MEEEESGSGNYTKIYLGTIFLLLVGIGAMTFLWSNKRNSLSDCEQTNTKYQDTINGMNKMLSSYVGDMSTDLKSELRNMLNTYDKLILKDASKSDTLNAQNERIQAQIEKIERLQRSGNFNASQLVKLKEENETLRGIMRGYVYEIDSLNTLNLQKDLIITETTQSLDERTTERDQYKKEAEEKTEQVKIGSKLSAYNFNSGALKSMVKNKPTTKARQALQFQSSFTISGNLIAQSGSKSVFMQIIGPDGKILQNMSSYVTETENGAISYTEKKVIDYQNKALDMTIYYDIRNGAVSKGNYKIRIYCNESLIGSDSFTLR